ncbi:MAG: hypothetical protein A2176_08195 [Spirochaetes bacterium RBG_13_51_14]|nr:MAG: hypothetical protein A2176_08195 [Spirochaetes bacterium RBG_13_51_14]
MSRYLSGATAFLAYGIFVIFLYALYRVRIYWYLQSLYPDLKLTSFAEYGALSLHEDSVAIFCTLLTFFIVPIIPAGFQKIKYFILSALSIILIFFLLFSMEFFRVYETTFQKNFAGEEHFSGLGNIVDSARAEFSAEFYILFILLTALALFIIFFLFRRDARIITCPGRNPAGIPPASRLFTLLPPALLLIAMATGLATDSSVPVRKFGPRYEKDQARKYCSMLREFSMNPVYNLFSPESRLSSADPSTRETGVTPFSFRLNTDSLVSQRRYARQDIVPRFKKYNIILYFFESTPYKYYDTTINGRYVIDTWHRLEKNSINFRSHYANYPLSANALLSVLASAYDMNTKDMVIQKYPDIKLSTLPEILNKNGYRSCLIHTGGLGYAGQKRFLKNRKFDEILEYAQLITEGPYNQQVGWGVDERSMIRPAVEFIRKEPGKPYLLILLPVNPHHPYAIPDKRFQITGEVPENSSGRERSWHNYLNSLHYSDVSLGMLVDELERRNLLDNTLLFLFADHGEAFYQHKMNYNHPLYIYNENVHVPFLIYSRRIFASPVYFNGITRHIDILPTILDILGISQPPEQEGISIISSHREQMALIHTSWKDDYMGVVDRNWKYITRTKDMIEELYDLNNDPGETSNVAAQQPGVVERYRRFVMNARHHKNDYYLRILKK